MSAPTYVAELAETPAYADQPAPIRVAEPRLRELSDADLAGAITVEELQAMPRTVSHPLDAAKFARALLSDLTTEHVYALLLNSRHSVLCVRMISRGTLGSAPLDPRGVFGPALALEAAAVILAHNHPSGDPTPSDADRAATARLVKAGTLLGVPLLDHLVIGGEQHTSIRSCNPGLWG